MSGASSASLTRLKIHDIRTFRSTFFQKQLPGFFQCGRVKAEGLVALLAAGNGLEDQITGGSLPDRLHLGRHVGQDTNLGRNLPMFVDLLEPSQHLPHLFRAVGHRIQTDHRITGTEAETFQGRCRDAFRIVRGVVGLQSAA